MDDRRRTPALLVVLVAASAAAVVLVRRRGRRPGDATGPQVVQPDAPVAKLVEREWRCECGQAYRVSGQGRHRVLWPEGATISDAVLDDACVKCERPLSEV